VVDSRDKQRAATERNLATLESCWNASSPKVKIHVNLTTAGDLRRRSGGKTPLARRQPWRVRDLTSEKKDRRALLRGRRDEVF